MFTGKVALVTGGGRGIGKGIALSLAAEGAVVALMGRNLETLEATAALIRSRGGEAFPVVGNVGSSADATRAVAEVMERCGRLDFLVNNAGIFDREMQGYFATPPEVHAELVAVNFLGVSYMCQAAAQAMLKNGGGAIVNIASTTATGASAYQPIYGATKAAVLHLTQSLASILGPEIRVNAVTPSTTMSYTEDEAIPESEQQQAAEVGPQFAMGRIGYPEDVARAVKWLLSDEARYISAANIMHSGGGRAVPRR